MSSENGSSGTSVASANDMENKKRGFDRGKEVMMIWRNLSVVLPKQLPKERWWDRKKTINHVILDNVSGYCKSGVLTAIMGASGAGKTTLLATISQRSKLACAGDILVNGRALSRDLIAKISGFVPQHDLVYRTLTVIEHMEFMARLMVDQKMRRLSRNRRIYCLLSELGLLRCCKTRLGQLSGGEMKRLSLAVQLLTDPPLLYCDEPTTGLDSYSAGVVLEYLRQCAERGKAVLATIHQPASGHFDLFHEVILLAGGRVAYSGPVLETSSYFNSVGLVCPASYNPAEFYVQQLAVLPGKEEECTRRNNWLCDEFASSDRGKAIKIEILAEVERHATVQQRGLAVGNWSTYSSTTTESQIHSDCGYEREFLAHIAISKPNKFVQLYWLVWRSVKDLKRNCTDVFLRFILLMLIATFISTPYIGITQNPNQKTIQNLQGFMYLIITEVVFTFSYSVFHTFPREIPILLRELANGLYKPGPYYISKMVIILFRSLFEGIIYAVFIFWIAELGGGFEGCVMFTLPIVFAALSATAYGSLMSAAFESIATANLVSVPLEMLGVMFSGLYLQLTGLSRNLSWIKFLSQFYYGQEAISITQWDLLENIECSDDPNLPCISNGAGALNKYGYDSNNYVMDLLGLSSIYFLANFFGFVALWLRSRQSAVY